MRRSNMRGSQAQVQGTAAPTDTIPRCPQTKINCWILVKWMTRCTVALLAFLVFAVLWMEYQQTGTLEAIPRTLYESLKSLRGTQDLLKKGQHISTVTQETYEYMKNSSLPGEVYERIRSILTDGGEVFKDMKEDAVDYLKTFIPQSDNKPELVMLLIGKTGVGKSTTGNIILGNKTFLAARSAKSVTKNTLHGRSMRFGRKLVVVDTPGLHDTQLSHEEVLHEISKCYTLTSPGFHAILLVTSVNRFTPEDEETVGFFVERFGDALYRYLIVIFAGKDFLVKDNQSLEEYVETLEENSKMRALLDRIHHDRKIAFGLENNEYEVKKLISMINHMSDNGKYHYTNANYEKAERVFQDRLKKESEKVKKEKEKEVQNFIRNFMANTKLDEEKEKALFQELLDEKMRQFEQKFRENTREEVNSNTSWLLESVKEMLTDLRNWFLNK